MLYNLNKDNNLKGYGFEYIIRILLRRKIKNNFIFQSIRFSNLEEITNKYKLIFPEKIIELKNLISENWNKFDLIEFNLNNVKERIVNSIKLYDVKTQNFNSKRKYLDVCKSNYDFFVKLNAFFNIKAQIVKVVLFADWQFEVIINDYDMFSIKIYSRYKN